MTKMVPLADGSLETRHKINCFKDWLKLNHPEKGIKTKEDAILYAIEQAENSIDLTYDEVETLYSISSAVDDSNDPEFQKNCVSGSKKLHVLMKRMKEKDVEWIMVEFKTNKLWVVFQSYALYSPYNLIIYDNESDARETAKRTSGECLSLNDYLENKEEYDRNAGDEEQTRIDNGQYADPYDE